jgi:flagellar biosynthesis/type III secretory pathway chaperone
MPTEPTKDYLHHLVESLREELKEYGEMLVLLDQQQEMVMRRQTQDLLQCVQTINTQVENVIAARLEREQRQRNAARMLGLAEDTTFSDLIPQAPGDYRPLIQALVQENNELLKRIQRRARQNHILLSRIVELMQRLFDPFFPGSRTTTYTETGVMAGTGLPKQSLYEAIG